MDFTLMQFFSLGSHWHGPSIENSSFWSLLKFGKNLEILWNLLSSNINALVDAHPKQSLKICSCKLMILWPVSSPRSFGKHLILRQHSLPRCVWCLCVSVCLLGEGGGCPRSEHGLDMTDTHTSPAEHTLYRMQWKTRPVQGNAHIISLFFLVAAYIHWKDKH